jgi:hypothetical protein
VGQFILNLEDDFICTATKADNYLEKAVKVLQTYTDVGQVVFRDIPMEGYDDAEIGELRDNCFVMKNIYPDHSPCYTNQAHLMPKRI